jgi:hypothetical protein
VPPRINLGGCSCQFHLAELAEGVSRLIGEKKAAAFCYAHGSGVASYAVGACAGVRTATDGSAVDCGAEAERWLVPWTMAARGQLELIRGNQRLGGWGKARMAGRRPANLRNPCRIGAARWE